jgi:hypothetical protein
MRGSARRPREAGRKILFKIFREVIRTVLQNQGGNRMRMIVDLSMPPEPFNTLVRKGTAGETLQKILGELKPEGAYFTAREGKRGGILIMDVSDASKIPSIAEPFFLHFDAQVQFHPCMTPDDLAKSGLDEIGKKYK